MTQKTILIFAMIFGFCFSDLTSQSDCLNVPFANTLGSRTDEEKGYSLAISPLEQVIYLGALKNDSVAIVKIKPTGEIIWSRTLDIIPGRADHVGKIIVDSEGMIAISGVGGSHETGGKIFAFRYDPFTNTILWAKEIVSIGNGDSPGIQELGPGGDYLMSNNVIAPVNNQEIYKLNRNTGEIIPSFSKRYDLGSSETLGDILFHNGKLYSTGRFTDGGSEAQMRTTLIKMNPDDGVPEWTILGHRPISVDARLYGVDMVIDQDEIYSISVGDPSGTSINFTQLFIQKTSLNGEVAWVKQYQLPGTNDWADEIISSDNGFVILARNRVSPSDIILFKIDREGNVLWARKFNFSVNDNSISIGYVFSQLIEFQEHIYFTAFAEINSSFDILLVKTNLQGEISDACVETAPIDIQVIPVSNPTFYTVQPIVTDYIPELVNLSLDISTASPMSINSICNEQASVTVTVSATICQGEFFEGYDDSGTYTDTFSLTSGCDSIRILSLTVENCGCGSQVAILYGSQGVRERGLSLAPALENDGYYVAGLKADSLLLIKFSISGLIQWAKTIDVIPGKEDHAVSIITDSDGMIGISGIAGNPDMGGTAFVLRFNPYSQSILWIREVAPNVTRDRVHGLNQNGPEGNYLLLSNLVDNSNSNDDCQITEIDIQTGNLTTGISKNYHLGASETLWEVVRHGEFLYGNGRYTDGEQPQNMRHVISKIDATTFEEVWTKLGHKPNSVSARLYGFDLVIDETFIYAGYYGDPSGTSTSNNKLYIQKTTLDGEIQWLKHYEFPLSTEWGYEIAKSGNGFVVYVVNRAAEGELYMFKIDREGNLLWSRTYLVNTNINTVTYNIGSSQMISVGDHLVFIATADDLVGEQDILIIQTDSNGIVAAPCVTTNPLALTVTDVVNPVFYDVEIEESDVQRANMSHTTQAFATSVLPLAQCAPSDSIITSVSVTICEGQSYELYTESGIYQDTFLTSEGCDSIRILTLEVTPRVIGTIALSLCPGGSYLGYTETGIYIDTFAAVSGCDSIRELYLFVRAHCDPTVLYDLDDCESYMINGSHMDYSEFIPDYPAPLTCASTVSASILYRAPPAENKHSCTPGLNNTEAMCVSALDNCNYLPGNMASIVFEIEITPETDSLISLDSIVFYEKAPAIYNWIDGPSGPNNYPLFFGIRVLTNGTEIYEQHDIPTALTWTHRRFNLPQSVFLLIDESSTIRIELLAYCLVGNGVDVAAWDIEDVKFFASCFEPFEFHQITGDLTTRNDQPIKQATVQLGERADFSIIHSTGSDAFGQYRFDSLATEVSYYLKANKNTNLLQGVNTLDLLTLQRHLLGKTTFRTLDQYIAADINKSGTINVLDILELRRCLLGISTSFTNNTSWRFGIQPVPIESTNMTDFEEVRYIESLNEPVSEFDFLGVKIGDINQDIQLATDNFGIESRSNASFPIRVEEQQHEMKDETSILFKAGEATTLEGLQIALRLRDLRILNVNAGKIPLTTNHFNIDHNGILRLSFSDTNPITLIPGEVMFSLVVESDHSGGVIEKVEMAEQVLAAEIYIAEETRSITLQKQDLPDDHFDSKPFYVDIAPNPFKDQFKVEFFIPEDGLVRLNLFTPVGEEIFAMKKEMMAGKHIEVISPESWKGGNSILLCRIMYGQEVITRKIVKWE